MTFKPSSVLFSSLLLLFPSQITNSCGWFLEEDEWYYRPFSQYLVDLPQFEPFFYSYHYFHYFEPDERWTNGHPQFSEEAENLEFWSEQYKGRFSIAAIREIVYGGHEKLILFQRLLLEKDRNVAKVYPNNKLAARWIKGEGLDELQYLLYAYEVLPHVAPVSWWEETNRDADAMQVLEDKALELRLQTNDPYLKFRYAFQAMRLAHYAGRYNRCLLLFEEYVKGTENLNGLYGWCLSLKAGAHRNKGEYAAAAYYYSRVFALSPSKSKVAKTDFYIDGEDAWQQALSMCQTKQETINLWLLAGLHQPNAAIPAMKAIEILNPAAPELELLLAREMEKFQRNHMPERGLLFNQIDVNDRSAIPGADEAELRSFVQSVCENNTARTPAYWWAAQAYLLWVMQQDEAFETAIKKAKSAAAGQPDLLLQIEALNCLAQVMKATQITPEFEADVLPALQQLAGKEELHLNDTYRLCMMQLAFLYAQADDLVRAEICQNQATYTDPYQYPQLFPVSEMISLMESESHSPFSQFLLDVYPYTIGDMWEIRATLAMQQSNWKEAESRLLKAANAGKEIPVLRANPFDIHIYDCHDCDQSAYNGKMNKLEFCREMIQLHEQMTGEGEKNPKTLHQLANAYYNISYFGSSWDVIDYYRNSTFFGYGWSWDTETAFWPKPEDDIESFFNMAMPLKLYQKAAALTSDKEFAAFNTFLAAKCEQNTMYLSGLEINPDTYTYYSQSLQQLATTYRKTAFYLDAIEACKYFAYYVSTRE